MAKAIRIAVLSFLFLCSALFAQETRLPSGATIKGTVDSSGYHPPVNLRIIWRKQGSPDIVAIINTSAKFSGLGDPNYFIRYAGGINLTAQGYYLKPVRAEFVGGRHWVILRDIFKLLGINRVPSSEGYEVFDFALANFDSAPSCCDYERILGAKDPFAGAMCSCGRTGDGQPVPSGVKTPTPFDLKLDGRVLSFKWEGDGQANFTVYESPAVEGAGFYLLGTAKKTSVILDRRPVDGTIILLQARQKGKEPSDVPFRIGESIPIEPIDPPPPPPPVICKLTDVLPSTSLDDLWKTLSMAQREQVIIRVLEIILKERKMTP